jgi:hypothetical protein
MRPAECGHRFSLPPQVIRAHSHKSADFEQGWRSLIAAVLHNSCKEAVGGDSRRPGRAPNRWTGSASNTSRPEISHLKQSQNGQGNARGHRMICWVLSAGYASAFLGSLSAALCQPNHGHFVNHGASTNARHSPPMALFQPAAGQTIRPVLNCVRSGAPQRSSFVSKPRPLHPVAGPAKPEKARVLRS